MVQVWLHNGFRSFVSYLISEGGAGAARPAFRNHLQKSNEIAIYVNGMGYG